MILKIKKLKPISIILLLLCCLEAKDIPHNKMVLEFLFSNAAEMKYHELIKLRALNYEKAKHILVLEDIFNTYSSLELNLFSEKLQPHQINVIKGKENFNQKGGGHFDVHQWAYIHWLLFHEKTEELLSILKHLSDTDQIWVPIYIDNREGDYIIEYFINTQFMLSRYFIENYMKDNMQYFDPVDEGDKLYLWYSLFPEVNIDNQIKSIGNDLDYYEQLVVNNIYLNTEKKQSLNDFESSVQYYNSTQNNMLSIIESLESQYNDINMHKIWDDCECMEEYGVFVMKVMLGRILIHNEYKPIEDLNEMRTLEGSFEYFQNILKIITYKYGQIDHDLFCLYFANNFYNMEKQQPFITEYLNYIGRDENHKFALILSSTLNEIMAYTNTSIKGK